MKPLTWLLAAGNVLLLLALGWQMASAPPPAPALDPAAPSAAQWLEAQRELKDLRARLAALQQASRAQPATSVAPINASNAPSAPMQDAPASAGVALRQAVTHPGVQELLRRQQAAEVDGTYYRLFDELQLTTQERAHFKELLQKRAKLEADIALQLLDSSKTPEQRRQILEQAAENQRQFGNSIRAFLNDPKDWQRFETYEAGRRERSQFEAFGRRLFAASGEHLSPAQEERLIEAMASMRLASGSPLNALLQRITQPGGATATNLSQWEELQRQANAGILAQSKDLTATQQRSLQDFLEQQLQRTLQALKLGAQLR